jgi:hypothetical protein
MVKIYKYGLILLIFILVIIPEAKTQNPNWQSPIKSQFTYTANVIADIQLDDVMSNNAEDRIAFFVGNELRGLSQPIMQPGGIYIHFITLYSNVTSEWMEIKVYQKENDQVYTYAEPLHFKTQSIFGSVDMPLNVSVYSNDDAPISINDIPFQTTFEGLAFKPIELSNYLVQVDNQEVIWSYTPNPNLTVSIAGSILNVSAVSGFTGLTTLNVRATELPITTLLQEARSGLNGSRVQSTTQYAETEINYFVTPAYTGPAWNNIPSQGIVIGNQFAPISLHNYEYQYAGPAIQ